MKYADIEYTSTGGTTYNVPFTYINASYVKVYLDDVETTAFTWGSPTSIILDVAPAVDVIVRIKRESSPTSRLVDYGDGTGLTEIDLDLDSIHSFDLIQETKDEGESNRQNLQDQLDVLVASNVTTADITVKGVSQGSYSDGNVIAAGTLIEDIITKMLQIITPPTLSLSGSGSLVVESGTLLTNILTPTYTANDAGGVLTYELRKGGVPINTVYGAYTDLPAFNIVDTSVTYDATVNYDAGTTFPAGSVASNAVIYRGARSIFSGLSGDIVNIRTNPVNTLDAKVGSVVTQIGDGASLTYVFAYPDTLPVMTSLFLSNTGGNYNITGDVVQHANQSVNDASGANPVSYKVFSYTALIPIAVSDTLTMTI